MCFIPFKLKFVTVSGIVCFWAIYMGTPSSSRSMLASGDTTVRLEKSTLFPHRFPRIRPFLPFRRVDIERILVVRMQFPGFFMFLESFNIYIDKCPCSWSNSLSNCGVLLSEVTSACKRVFVFTISCNFSVRSS